MELVEATVRAAHQRLRPILMTSLAFVFGVMPLALSSGAGSGGQNAIGTGVIGGMIAATVLAIFFVPLFFVVMLRLFKVQRRKIHDDDPTLAPPPTQPEATLAAPPRETPSSPVEVRKTPAPDSKTFEREEPIRAPAPEVDPDSLLLTPPPPAPIRGKVAPPLTSPSNGQTKRIVFQKPTPPGAKG